jgi:hypothetical protein
MKVFRLIGLLSLALSVGASAQPSGPSPAPATARTVQDFGAADKTCMAWTDQCRTCRREADDTVNCSNIGVACQPAEITCTARREPAK